MMGSQRSVSCMGRPIRFTPHSPDVLAEKFTWSETGVHAERAAMPTQGRVGYGPKAAADTVQITVVV